MKKRFFIILVILISGGFFIWQGIYLPKGLDNPEEILFKIKRGESSFLISENLEKSSLIKHRIFFQVYILLKGKQNNLQAGNYLLSPLMSVSEIAQRIIRGEDAGVRVTIPEGFNLQQIEERISEVLGRKLNLDKEKVSHYKKDYNSLRDVPDSFNLEGFLFPDTYEFEVDVQVQEVICQMLKNFDKKLTFQLREETKKQGKTIFEIIVMASLLEKEVRTFEDRQKVSGILWKRLEHNIPLQVDATLSYITGKKTTKISKEETQIDSPYNTYKYKGLPLGPICNPGIESIKAVLYPEDSKFWYYLSNSDGETIFSKTLEEHNIAKAKFLK